jgi:hypothetical protein
VSEQYVTLTIQMLIKMRIWLVVIYVVLVQKYLSINLACKKNSQC